MTQAWQDLILHLRDTPELMAAVMNDIFFQTESSGLDISHRCALASLSQFMFENLCESNWNSLSDNNSPLGRCLSLLISKILKCTDFGQIKDLGEIQLKKSATRKSIYAMLQGIFRKPASISFARMLYTDLF